MGNTLVDLPNDLQKAVDDPMTTEGQKMIIRGLIPEAKRGFFHDFGTPLATPKMALHATLLAAKLGELAQKVVNGDYDDESPDDKIQEKE